MHKANRNLYLIIIFNKRYKWIEYIIFKTYIEKLTLELQNYVYLGEESEANQLTLYNILVESKF